MRTGREMPKRWITELANDFANELFNYLKYLPISGCSSSSSSCLPSRRSEGYYFLQSESTTILLLLGEQLIYLSIHCHAMPSSPALTEAILTSCFVHWDVGWCSCCCFLLLLLFIYVSHSTMQKDSDCPAAAAGAAYHLSKEHQQ